MEQVPQSPPRWGDDPLSKFMSEADHNARVTALRWPDVYEVQQRAAALLERIGEILELDPDDANLLVPRTLVIRSRSAILGAMRSAMSGQAVEAQPVLRQAIENAWYALHVARDPAPPTRAQIWWDRDVSEEAIRACRAEFTVANVRQTHEALDADTVAAMKKLYDDTITHGGHPNERGVASSLRIDRSRPGVVRLGVGILHPGTAIAMGTLKAAVDVTVGVAKTVGLIYSFRFRFMEVDDQINRLAQHSAAVFPKYAEAARNGALT